MRRAVRATGYAALICATIAVGLTAAPAQRSRADAAIGVSYSYDPTGRLSSITTPDGSAVYHYDASGNITSIDRLPPGQLAIFQFAPQSGEEGDGVTIRGSGFSSTAADDTVKSSLPAVPS